MRRIVFNLQHGASIWSEVKRIWYSDPLATRVWCANIGITLGLQLTLSVYAHVEPFVFFKRHLMLHWIGAWFLFCGVLQLWGVWSRHRKVQSATAMVGLISWAFLTAEAFLLGAWGLAVVPCGAFALMWAWVFLQSPRRV